MRGRRRRPDRHVFAADAPNQLWLVDITEHKAEGKLYRCAIKDACSGKIVGYSIDSRMKSRLVAQALENAVAMRGDVASCVATATGSVKFRSRKFLRALARHRLVGSMGRVGSSRDNAAMEPFFALLQKGSWDVYGHGSLPSLWGLVDIVDGDDAEWIGSLDTDCGGLPGEGGE